MNSNTSRSAATFSSTTADEEDDHHYREFNQISLDQIEPIYLNETVYRSISVLPASSSLSYESGYFASEFSATTADDFQAASSSTTNGASVRNDAMMFSKPTLQKEPRRTNNATPSTEQTTQVQPRMNTSIQSNLKASAFPELLMPSNFEIKAPLDSIHSKVMRLLRDSNGLSFDFQADLCQWTIVVVNGSVNAKIQLTVYDKQADENVFLVEANRLSGDCYTLRSIFSQVKSLFCGGVRESHDLDAYPLPLPTVCTGEADLCEGLDRLFRMAKQPTSEAQCEASKMLCVLTLDEGAQMAAVEKGLLAVLHQIILKSPCEWAQQHAMIALAQLSDAFIFQTEIINEGFLPLLLDLARDGPYNTAELRRCAVHVLANLCTHNSIEVGKALSQQQVLAWMNGVDSLSDERLKVHAIRAKESLSHIVFAN